MTLKLCSMRLTWKLQKEPGRLEEYLLLQMFTDRCCFLTEYILCYLPAGRSVLGKTVPEVLSMARGRGPRAVLKTEGTVFPNTDWPRPANNMFIFFSLEKYFVRNICVEFFTEAVTHCAHFGQANLCCLQKFLKEEIQFSLILKLSNEGFTFHRDF